MTDYSGHRALHTSYCLLAFTIRIDLDQQTLEQDLAVRPLPQTSVHALLTEGVEDEGSSSSPPWLKEGLETCEDQGAGPGWRAVLWSSLSHSVHFIGALQSRAR